MSGGQPATRTSGILEEIEALIARMQAIQRAIAGTGEPASRLEIEELKELGRRYAQLVARLDRDENLE